MISHSPKAGNRGDYSMTYLSFLMGGSEITDQELTDLGIEIVEKESDGDRKLKIPAENIKAYFIIIKEKLSPGFWNEVVGEKEISFVFKFKDGSIKEFNLSLENEAEIDKLAAEFVGKPLGDESNVYKWLSENYFYHDFMLEHYKDLINR